MEHRLPSNRGECALTSARQADITYSGGQKLMADTKYSHAIGKLFIMLFK